MRKREFMDELKKALEKVLSDPTVGIVLLTEKFGQEFPDIIDTFRLERKMPLLIEIPDRHGRSRQVRGGDMFISGICKTDRQDDH